MSVPSPAELIARKRDGAAWSDAEIDALARGIADGSWSEAQLGALAMAVFLRGATTAETARLTLAMRDSGEVVDTSAIASPKVDKHSTGGVGDKVSLLLAPWVAACGACVPMVSGRGLGHTGGTLDKLEAIPGYGVEFTPRELVALCAEHGYAIVAASARIAPADRRLYAVRDVTGTVASIPLIVSSILSKKLAAGLDALVLDVKVGRAAFLPGRAQAEELARALVATGSAAGLRVTALLTDMDQPLGAAVGNALEVREVIDCLHGGGPADLWAVTRALALEMLLLAGLAPDRDAAAQRLDEARDGGALRARFVANLRAQGGDPAVVDDPARLPRAPVVQELCAPRDGAVTDVDPLCVGQVALALGAGRRRGNDAVDPRVGVVCRRKRGAAVVAGEPLAEVHAVDAATAHAALEALRAAWRIEPGAPPAPSPPVLGRLTAAELAAPADQ